MKIQFIKKKKKKKKKKKNLQLKWYEILTLSIFINKEGRINRLLNNRVLFKSKHFTKLQKYSTQHIAANNFRRIKLLIYKT